MNFLELAYIREGERVHTGDAMLIAVLNQMKLGAGRKSKEFRDLRKLLNDPNLDRKEK